MIEEFILAIQGFFTNWMAGTADSIPLGYAFGAGMLSSVNPCGFAMLPAFMSLYLGTRQANYSQIPMWQRGANGVVVGGTVSLGFVIPFAIMGLGISTGGRFLIDWIPWMGLVVGTALVGTGIILLSGKHVYSAVPARLAAHIGNPGTTGVRSFFLFGVAYAVASLSCTLPVFLVVVGSAITAGGILLGTYQFVSYSLGMAVVLILITLSLAVFKGGIIAKFKRVLPFIERISAAFLVLVGTFIIYYWLTIGGLLD
ncbi:MAG: cytochrome c biogenesis protein CcdA [Dehalococcoidia bacterium]